MRARRSRWVAEMMRTSTFTGSLLPSGSIVPSCSTRSSLACAACDSSADLVEEQRAAVRRLEAAFPAVGGAGEGAAFVPEQLRLDQACRGTRAQLTATNGSVAPAAAFVQRARHQLLAGAALARDDHRRVAVRDRLHALDQREHAGRVADQLVAARRGALQLVCGLPRRRGAATGRWPAAAAERPAPRD